MRIVPHLLGAAITTALLSTSLQAAELTGTLKKSRTAAPSPSGIAMPRFRFPTWAMTRASRWATPTTCN